METFLMLELILAILLTIVVLFSVVAVRNVG